MLGHYAKLKNREKAAPVAGADFRSTRSPRGKKIDKLIVIEAFVQYFFNKNPRDFFLIIQRSLGINLRHSSQRRQIYRFEEISVKFVRYFI